MRTESQETIACCVASPTASWTVMRAVRAAGANPTSVTRHQMERDFGGAARWAALIFELQPNDPDAESMVTSFRRRRPSTPVLLYTPMTANAEPLLEKLVGREGVYLHLQCECANQSQSLCDNVCRVLSHAPGTRLKALIAQSLPGMSDRLRDYTARILTALGTDNGPLQLTTATVASEMGLVVRTLERASAACGYPKPKELLSWMILLYLTLLGCSSQMTPYKVARRLRLSTCTMNRLRQRLLSPVESEAWKRNRDNGRFRFNLVFKAFVARCGESVTTATIVLATDSYASATMRSYGEQNMVEAASGW